jgi:hypothetical protein
VTFSLWLRKMLNQTRHKMMQNDHSNSDEYVQATLSESSNQQSHNAETSNNDNNQQQLPPHPPAPVGLPNSQPFIPVGASTSQYSNDFAQIVHPQHPSSIRTPTLISAIAGSSLGGGEARWNDSAAGMLHGLLGDGHDWPPWLTTGVSCISSSTVAIYSLTEENTS